MIKKKQNNFDLEFLKDFFKIKYNKWVFVGSTFLFICILLYFFNFHKIIVFPSDNEFYFGLYNDSANGGNSEIINYYFSDSLINIDFNLKKGFISPYVGISIAPKKNKAIDLSNYNFIHLSIEGVNVKSIGISLFTANPYEKSEVNSKDLCFNSVIEISQKRKEYIINFNQLKIPDWWYASNNVSPDKIINPEMANVLNINLGTAFAPALDTKCSLKIHSISFERNNSKLIWFLSLIEFFIILTLSIIHFFRLKFKQNILPITIAYKPIEIKVQNNQLNGFLDYINSNFHETDLSLEQVSKITGINERKIANTIQESFGCNFKSYINQIRINESKRLLKDSELNIGEIAFKVGFNNQSHFNRVFKSLEGTSPSAFKDNIK